MAASTSREAASLAATCLVISSIASAVSAFWTCVCVCVCVHARYTSCVCMYVNVYIRGHIYTFPCWLTRAVWPA